VVSDVIGQVRSKIPETAFQAGEPVCHMVEATCHTVEATLHTVEATLHPVEAAIHEVKTLIHEVETLIHDVEPPVDLGEPSVHRQFEPIEPASEARLEVADHPRQKANHTQGEGPEDPDNSPSHCHSFQDTTPYWATWRDQWSSETVEPPSSRSSTKGTQRLYQ